MMTDKKLRDTLLKLDATEPSGAGDARQQTERILLRSKRWVWFLTGLTIFFSLLTVAAVFLLFWFFHLYLEPIVVKAFVDLGAAESATEYDSVRVGLGWLYKCWLVSLGCVALSLVTLMLTALSTVWLILASRRATIRHVNASLIEISEQLKRLTGSEKTGEPGA